MDSNHTKLLERDEPRLALEEALTAARGGRGHIVSIEGEAGIGKTSLAVSFAESHRRDARVYVGGCEHLATAEPLGPLRDVERESGGRFALSTTSQRSTFDALLRLLTSGRGPALLVLEDIHWADDATLDLFRFLGRRIRGAPILVVTTFRNDEAPSLARLAGLWADLPRDCCERIELERLSPAAVSILADQTERAAREIYEATGGNPFHVTEYLAMERSSVPRTVRDATLARAALLSTQGRRTLDCASIFPRQIDQELLHELAEDASYAGVEECMRAGMLQAQNGALAFRHELARRALRDAIAPLRLQKLHALSLELLKGRKHASAAELAHHAKEAEAFEDLLVYSLRAADEAAALGAHRESAEHIARVLEHCTWLEAPDRVGLLERQADESQLCGAYETAMRAIEEAVAARKRTDDAPGLGNALRIQARVHWHLGEPEQAERLIEEALEVMRDHRETWQYATALCTQSQLDMLADRNDQAIPRALEAMALAESMGRWTIYMHALTNATTARCSADPETGIPQMVAAIVEARARDALDVLPRLYCNLVYMMTGDRRYQNLFEYFEAGIEAAVARDSAHSEAYMRGARAIALLDQGRIPEAVATAEFVVGGAYPRGTARFNAGIALARGRIRTGVPEDGVLDELRSMPTSHRDIMRLAPLAVVDAEALWLGLPRPGALDRLRAAFEVALRAQGQGWTLADTALWLAILREPVHIPDEIFARLRPAPRAHIAGHWREAAKAWCELGCVYEQAIALSTGDEAAQREALALFDGLGAVPAATRLRRQMKALGVPAVPRGPITQTRASPAGLTRRQAQVLALLAEGLSNATIAKRLYISPKTTEHHVSAVIAQLGASTRKQAAEAARERGLLRALQN